MGKLIKISEEAKRVLDKIIEEKVCSYSEAILLLAGYDLKQIKKIHIKERYKKRKKDKEIERIRKGFKELGDLLSFNEKD
ncbi:MAG: hypothetical protein QXI58_07275 [Candidatus Micrarchaeia archaeon]